MVTNLRTKISSGENVGSAYYMYGITLFYRVFSAIQLFLLSDGNPEEASFTERNYRIGIMYIIQF